MAQCCPLAEKGQVKDEGRGKKTISQLGDEVLASTSPILAFLVITGASTSPGSWTMITVVIRDPPSSPPPPPSPPKPRYLGKP